jgi:hypothetical protein
VGISTTYSPIIFSFFAKLPKKLSTFKNAVHSNVLVVGAKFSNFLDLKTGDFNTQRNSCERNGTKSPDF